MLATPNAQPRIFIKIVVGFKTPCQALQKCAISGLSR